MDNLQPVVGAIMIDRIRVLDRKRPLDPEKVKKLAESIQAVGLLNPITVRWVRTGDPEDENQPIPGYYQLVAGYHRLEACRQLGWDEIRADNRKRTDIETELTELDENLVRSDLNPAQMAAAVARRKQLWEEMYPETRHGHQSRRGNQHSKSAPQADLESRNNCDSPQADLESRNNCDSEPERYTAATSVLTGKSERTIQQLAKLGTDIQPDVLQAVAKVDHTQADLIALSKLDTAAQEKVAKAVADGEPVKDAVKAEKPPRKTKPFDPFDATGRLERTVEKFIASWPEGESKKPLISTLRGLAAACEEGDL